MTGQCNAKPMRRTTGWYRWYVACPCGWRADASGREDAAALAKRHNTEKAATDQAPDYAYTGGECCASGSCEVCDPLRHRGLA